jgi:hypothetical protein
VVQYKPISKSIITKDITKQVVTKKDIKTKIAIVYSSKTIGKYLLKIADISALYMLNKNDDFELNFFDIKNNTIDTMLNNLKTQHISKIMLYITEDNIIDLYNYPKINQFDIYLPLVNKSYDSYNPYFTNIIYGGIDYKKQFELLKPIANSHIVEIYDNNQRNKKLHNALDKQNVTSYILSGKYPNYKKFLKQHKKIKNASLILNLDIVKSSILLSQITANDTLEVSQVLSVQNNFTPLLFVLTQIQDTQNLVIANSIINVDKKLYDLNKLNGHNLKYNWVDYSTILGLEYLKYKKQLLFGNVKIKDNQVNYQIKLYKTDKKSFIPYYN